MDTPNQKIDNAMKIINEDLILRNMYHNLEGDMLTRMAAMKKMLLDEARLIIDNGKFCSCGSRLIVISGDKCYTCLH